eukprot:jgi/Picsp_1/3664/NSC_06501-R1_60 kda lysophospholipase
MSGNVGESKGQGRGNRGGGGNKKRKNRGRHRGGSYRGRGRHSQQSTGEGGHADHETRRDNGGVAGDNYKYGDNVGKDIGLKLSLCSEKAEEVLECLRGYCPSVASVTTHVGGETPTVRTAAGLSIDAEFSVDSLDAVSNLCLGLKKALGIDGQVVMVLPVTLSKEERAVVHECVGPLEGLQTYSIGIGKDRAVHVASESCQACNVAIQDRENLDNETEERSKMLRQWCLENNIMISRDEAKEFLAKGAKEPKELASIWESRWPLQMAMNQLCRALLEEKMDEFGNLVIEHKSLLCSGAYDEETGMGPLHLAARCGYLGALGLLIENGYPVDAKDRSDSTALRLAIAFEQGEAEGLLRRAGAKDAESPWGTEMYEGELKEDQVSTQQESVLSQCGTDLVANIMDVNVSVRDDFVDNEYVTEKDELVPDKVPDADMMKSEQESSWIRCFTGKDTIEEWMEENQTRVIIGASLSASLGLLMFWKFNQRR